MYLDRARALFEQLNTRIKELRTPELLQGDQFGTFRSRRCVPCSMGEVHTLEERIGRSLPAAYKEFLLWAGKYAGGFLAGSDWEYGTLPDLQESARALLKEDKFWARLNGIEMSLDLPDDAFVFLIHQGSSFYFFRFSEGEDPPVYEYLDGMNTTAFTSLNRHFSEWIVGELARHISGWERIPGLSPQHLEDWHKRQAVTERLGLYRGWNVDKVAARIYPALAVFEAIHARKRELQLHGLDEFEMSRPITVASCTREQVLRLEEQVGRPLPDAYKEFLLWMGGGTQGFLTHGDWQYDKVASLQERAVTILEQNQYPTKLPEDAFVFFLHSDGFFSFLRTAEGNDPHDPPVYDYSAGEAPPSFQFVCDRFSHWIVLQLADHAREVELTWQKWQAERSA